MKNAAGLLILLLISSFSLTGCSSKVTLVTVQSLEAPSPKIDLATAFNRVTMVLVDRGLDIKTSNQDAGLVTTEYKKFASMGGDPPFDYYLQIKVTLREGRDGMPVVKMVPLVKEQNRMNAAAFTEHELTYYTGEAKAVQKIKSMKPDGWQNLGQVLFMNVVQDIAEITGVSVDEMTHNVTRVEETLVSF